MSAAYELVTIDHKLCLQAKHSTILSKPFSIDFADYLQRSNLGEGGRRLLLKAVKIKNEPMQPILDVTGGWARDAFFLAQQGFDITVIEKVEPVFKLLEDAYQRAQNDPGLAAIMQRMHFIHADAEALLRKGLPHKIIYLDPMFPERQKSAKVKKDLQILQSLPETFSDNIESVFNLARQQAARVIVKRPMAAPFLAESKPSFQYLGKTVRFDVYV